MFSPLILQSRHARSFFDFFILLLIGVIIFML